MGYFILSFILTVWVLMDARKRKNHLIGWSVPTLFLGPFMVPIYLAKRNLKEGEVREGGTGWNILKNFALLWTITIAVMSISGMVEISETEVADEWGQAGLAIGATMGLASLAFIWFCVLVGALLLGFFLKSSRIVEKGPTGPLADDADESSS